MKTKELELNNEIGEAGKGKKRERGKGRILPKGQGREDRDLPGSNNDQDIQSLINL
jgi:hypothetical protein